MVLQATIQAQSAFRKARKDFAEGVGALATQMGLELKPAEAAIPADDSRRGIAAAHSSRPASGASSVGSVSQPRLSIPDGSGPAVGALQTPQGQIMRGSGRRQAADAAPQAAPAAESNAAKLDVHEQHGSGGTMGETAGEGDGFRPLGQPAPLQQQAKQPAVASVVAHASAGQLPAPGYLSASLLQDASETKASPTSQVGIKPAPPQLGAAVVQCLCWNICMQQQPAIGYSVVTIC